MLSWIVLYEQDRKNWHRYSKKRLKVKTILMKNYLWIPLVYSRFIMIEMKLTIAFMFYW